MVIRVDTKAGNIYFTKAIELINDDKDIRLQDIEGDYVIIDVKEVDRIDLSENR